MRHIIFNFIDVFSPQYTLLNSLSVQVIRFEFHLSYCNYYLDLVVRITHNKQTLSSSIGWNIRSFRFYHSSQVVWRTTSNSVLQEWCLCKSLVIVSCFVQTARIYRRTTLVIVISGIFVDKDKHSVWMFSYYFFGRSRKLEKNQQILWKR